jgi:hypothetical protein
MRRADIEVPILFVAMVARKRLACYPRGNLFAAADLTTKYRLITKSYFRTGRNYFLPCPVRLASLTVKHPYAFTLYIGFLYLLRIPYEHLRYFLGGDRPSQTTHQTLSFHM